MNAHNKITKGSGNVFADLGFVNADEHQMKARIVMMLGVLIEEKELSQTKAAEIIGIKQPDLPKILRGNFTGFSLERLLGAVRSMGSDVEIKVKAHPDNQREGRLSLMVA